MTSSPVSVAVITGAGSPSGIGVAVARRLGADGCRILITSTTDRIFERVAELRADGIEAEGVVADLTDQGGVDAVVAAPSIASSPSRPHPDHDPVLPQESLTALQALEGYTIGAASAASAAGVAHAEGSISAGKVADLTILAADPLAIPPEELAGTAVLATVVGGEIQFAVPS